jgi:replicative DNA helicase
MQSTKKITTTTTCRSHFLDSATLNRTNNSYSWLVEQLLLPDQPAVLGGPRKCLKSSVAIDLAISLGTGKPFLGYFPVPKQIRVALLSGENSKATLRETAQRICSAKQVRLNQDCDVLWSFRLPQLYRETECDELKQMLKEQEVKVVIFDPLFLCLLPGCGTSAANSLYEIGPLLRQAARACQLAGATPIFVHHSTKDANWRLGSAELNDLAFSGVGEFVRQWLLLSRRKRYQLGTGEHSLILTGGGNAGQSGKWEVDIKEGQLQNDFSGRTWDVSVRVAGTSRDLPVRQARTSPRRHEPNDADVLDRLMDELASRPKRKDKQGRSHTRNNKEDSDE